MPFFTSDGTNMYVDVVGTGPSLLLLHEISLDHRQWTAQSEALRGEHRLFRLDWRGHGRSASAPTGHGWSGFAADARRALVQVGMDRLHPGTVIAQGVACDAALQLCLREPRALRAAVLVAPLLWGVEAGEEWRNLLQAMRSAARAGDLGAALGLLRADRAFAGIRADPELERSVRAMQERCRGDWLQSEETDPGTPTAQRLHECKLPLLVLCGREDREDFRHTAAQIAAQAPRAHVVELDGAYHFPNLETPESFNAVLKDFLAEHS